MPQLAPPNDFGLVATASWDDSVSSPPMRDQFTAQGVEVHTRDLPNIVGMGGNAYLMCYTSPKTGRAMTVLVVPHRAAVDQFAEDYFYFEMSADEALAGDMDVRWAEIYDRCEAFS